MKVTTMGKHTFYMRVKGKSQEKIELTLWAIQDEHGNTMYQVYSKTKPKL